MRTRIDDASRLAWLRDARAALEHHRIPWTVWEYSGLFGVTNGRADQPGGIAHRTLDLAVLAALGLFR